ncbi:sensor histidine kinase [Pseudonocardia endophytica]|uniref:histidine kinase n=1 Tax=Pseudonocardia endophytica TaxID=401976 RepID=A0A4R1HLI2_PSEEN|nr:histidine kinase [Pseudonocardia endophytica]TCK21961.1 signal transduction histidine kinase [Pseudonocardia endophytica]
MHRPPNPVTAVVSGLVAVGLLLLLPVLAGPDPEAAALPRPGSPGWTAVAVVVLGQAVAVAWVRRLPLVLLPGLTALLLPLALLAPGPAFSLTAVAVLPGVFLAVLARDLRRLWPALAGTALLVAVATLVNQVGSGSAASVGLAIAAVAQAALVVGLPLLFGLVVAARRDAEEARRQEVRAVLGEQEALLAAAISRQRTALSRELHDIAAHHMSGIALMAAAIGRQVDTDPEAAKRSAQQVREQSRAVLDDLRRLVGLLREDADADGPVENVAALVRTYRTVGGGVELSAPDEIPEPGPLAGLVAHRMVQESLANARSHAPGARCAVRIERLGDDRLAITVHNGPSADPDAGPGGGFGLIGMRERARLVGAELTYGSTPDGGWEVRLTVPLTDAPARVGGPLPEGLA